MASPLSRPAVLAITSLVMGAFAANSVLARLALRTTEIDAVTFTGVRLLAGALVLAGVLALRPSPPRGRGGRSGSWASALALFVYAAAFSLAYLSLATGTGALLLFGAVQLTMIGWGRVRGERLRPIQSVGVAAALAGLVLLVAPGVTAPALLPALTMAASGVAWGVYSLRGRAEADPVAATAGNFARAVPFAALLVVARVTLGESPVLDPVGIGWAVLSGAVTSGLGYVAWYAVLPSLRAASAATVQLSVPVLAALGGVMLLSEPVTLRLVVASVVTLGGIALVVRSKRPKPGRTAPPSPDRTGSTTTARSTPTR